MERAQIAYIRFELRNYHRNVKMLQGFGLNQLVSTKALQYTCMITDAIAGALAELPEEVVETVRLKYFVGVRADNFDLAYKQNVSERTVRRWDNLALDTIARYLGMSSVNDNNTGQLITRERELLACLTNK